MRSTEASTSTFRDQTSTEFEDAASSVRTDFDRFSNSFESSRVTGTQTVASRSGDENASVNSSASSSNVGEVKVKSTTQPQSSSEAATGVSSVKEVK